ncbi:uncharacterized protein LOC130934913 [Arachis stenosperma]|uniref:uncharacterized protein LOC130934913 n=1 Tax=Arachis stenosperma TaxID=217475 RepID=UPI0025AB8392|nr:uncharacterized protein LOC130934913 [Arachis stenosperma]
MDKLKLYFDGASVDKILRTSVSLFGREDRFCWPFRLDGIYTIKTGYHVARNEKSLQNNNPSTSVDLKFLRQEIWNLREPETIEHAWLLCPWTRAAWFIAQIQCCHMALTVSSFEKWMMELLGKMRLNAGAIYDLVWEVWKARNLAIYQKINPNPIMVIHKAKLMELEFAKMIEEPVKHATTSVGATAAVFRDHNRTLLSGINSTIVVASPLAVEALAVRAALIMSQNFLMQKVIIESDNQILIQALKSHASVAEIQVVLDDIRHLTRGIPNCGFTWVPREANSLAHEVARLTHQGALHQNWVMHKPISIRNILRKDNLAVSMLGNNS